MRTISKRASDLTGKLDGSLNYGSAYDYSEAVAAIADCITELEAELDELKEQYRWHSLEKDGLPELNQDVQLWSYTYREIRIGHFYDYEEGNETSPDIWFDDYDRYECFRLDELPKKYQWRYLNAPKEGE